MKIAAVMVWISVVMVGLTYLGDQRPALFRAEECVMRGPVGLYIWPSHNVTVGRDYRTFNCHLEERPLLPAWVTQAWQL